MIPLLMVCISIVKEGTFDEFHGGESIEQVFSMFFDDPVWDAEVLGNRNCVTFDGKAMYDNVEASYTFLFTVRPETGVFDLECVSINGRIASERDTDELLQDIYYAFENSGSIPPAKATPDMTPEDIRLVLEDCEELVRSGSFDGFEGKTVEDLFEDFFVDGRFKPLLGVDDAFYVDYSGWADYVGVRSEFIFQFAIDDGRESFVIASLEIAGKPVPDQELDAVLLDILQSYRK